MKLSLAEKKIFEINDDPLNITLQTITYAKMEN